MHLFTDISPQASFLRFSKSGQNLSGKREWDLKDTSKRESVALFYNRVLICGSWNPPFQGAQCCTFTRIASAPFVLVRLKGADTTCEAFTLIIPTKEALVTARRRCRPKEHLFPWRRRLRNLSRADSVIGHLTSFSLDSWKLLLDDVPYANSRKANFGGFSFQACAF